MDYGIFDLRTDVNACDCTRGCTDTVRESALKVDSGRKIPCRTGESNLRQWRAGPTLYPLSYIHAPVDHISPSFTMGVHHDSVPFYHIATNVLVHAFLCQLDTNFLTLFSPVSFLPHWSFQPCTSLYEGLTSPGIIRSG